MNQTEIVFLVEEAEEGGFNARAINQSIFTEADDMEALKRNVRDAVVCHFPDPQQRPKMIRLHWVRDEVITA